MVSIGEAVNRLRQPEYVGANRCTPCTVLNLGIAAVIAGAIALLVPWVGIVVFSIFIGVIYLRGYLVPGTPTLTKRYLPARVLRLFGKDLPVGRAFDGGTVSAESGVAENGNTKLGGQDQDADSDERLALAGVINQTETGDVTLTSGFRDVWREEIRTVRERTPGTDDVRRLFNAETVSHVSDQSFVVDGNTSIRWGSEAALVADVAAATVLKERVEAWSTFDRDRQRSVLLGLRLCLERCPSCDSTVDMSEDRVDPCCQKPHLVADSICQDCGAVLADAAVVDGGENESIQRRLIHS